MILFMMLVLYYQRRVFIGKTTANSKSVKFLLNFYLINIANNYLTLFVNWF